MALRQHPIKRRRVGRAKRRLLYLRIIQTQQSMNSIALQTIGSVRRGNLIFRKEPTPYLVTLENGKRSMDTLASQMQKLRQNGNAANPMNLSVPSSGTTMEQRIALAIRADYQRVVEARPDAAVCPYCDGMGGVGLNITDPSHLAFGRIFRCPCREAWDSTQDSYDAQKALAKLFKSSAIPESHQSITFASFDG